jgi:tRNA-dihydrouridine synthase 1
VDDVGGVGGVDGSELNVGCPQQCARKGRYGAFMMDDPDALVETVRLLSNTLRRCGTGDVPLLVKMRCYVNVEDTVVLCKRLEHAGCSCLTLHGRTKRDKGRTGKAHKALADWNQIKAVKAALRIPVIGNGNVRSKADALEMISVCGVDGVMSGMGLLSNPALFDDASMVGAAFPTAVTRIRVALRYLFLCSLHEPYHVCLSKHVQKILGDSLQKQYQGMHTLLLSYMSFSKKEGRANTSRLDLVNELEKMLVVEEERVMGGT